VQDRNEATILSPEGHFSLKLGTSPIWSPGSNARKISLLSAVRVGAGLKGDCPAELRRRRTQAARTKRSQSRGGHTGWQDWLERDLPT
jgi:hypothetical protein